MNKSGRRNEHQQEFHRQATILRRNLFQWDQTLQTGRVENWPKILGRLNAALNQASNLNEGIQDVLEHFVYLPKRCPVNPQDIPFFLSTRLATATDAETSAGSGGGGGVSSETDDKMTTFKEDPNKILRLYEEETAKMAFEFEENIIRY